MARNTEGSSCLADSAITWGSLVPVLVERIAAVNPAATSVPRPAGRRAPRHSSSENAITATAIARVRTRSSAWTSTSSPIGMPTIAATVTTPTVAPIHMASASQRELGDEDEPDHREPDDRGLGTGERGDERDEVQRESETRHGLRRSRDRHHAEHADPHPRHPRIITGSGAWVGSSDARGESAPRGLRRHSLLAGPVRTPAGRVRRGGLGAVRRRGRHRRDGPGRGGGPPGRDVEGLARGDARVALEHAELAPTFAPFVAWAEEREPPLVLASDGFAFYIQPTWNARASGTSRS